MRVVEFSMDGVSVKLASMSWAQAEKFAEAGQALIKRTDVTAEEWLDRTLTTVGNSLLGGGRSSEECTSPYLKAEFDMPTINAMYFRILELSGLRATNQGEAPAA